MSAKHEYECSLTGLTAPGEIQFEADDLDDLPSGWIRVQIARRELNPEYVLLQRVKNGMVAALMSQFPEKVRQAQGIAVRMQIDAQFSHYESTLSPYLTSVETVYVSDPEASPEVLEAFNTARESLGLDTWSEVEEQEPAETGASEEKPSGETAAPPAE